MSYKFLERCLYELGVSASQARLLAVLFNAERPMKPSVVARVLFQETQSITGMLHRLESRGWVRGSADADDRRAIRLELTAEGRSRTSEIIQISKGLYVDLFATAISPVEKRQVSAALRKVREAAFNLPETDFKLRRGGISSGATEDVPRVAM